MIELKATATKLTCLKPVDISCFVQNEVRVHVHLDRSWDGLTAYLTFKAGDVQKDCPYPYTGNYVPIPPELMVEANIGKIIQIGLAGYDGETTVRSLWCDAGRVFRGILYGTSAVPTMDMLQAIRKDNDETEQAVREMTDSVLAGIKTVEDTAARLDDAVEAAETSAEAAETSKTAASESATAAAGSAAAAAAAEQAAAVSMNAAQTAATNAQQSATEAGNFRDAAEQSAINALVGEENAKSYEESARAAMEGAQSAQDIARQYAEASYQNAVSAQSSAEYAGNCAGTASIAESNAASYASSAAESADSARNSASAAESAASDAAASQAAAQSAADAAQNAKNAAESANTAAQAAKTAAESANDNAQSAKNAAQTAQSGAEAAKTSAASSASAAASHASSAANSAESATNSADAAEKSSKAAKTSETNAAGSATAAESSKNEAASSAANAAASASAAKSSSASAASSAETAKSWAIGGTGTRAGEDTDNAKYYAGTAKASADAASGHSSTAAAKASDAASSASNAADSAAAAKTSEDNARAAQAAAEAAKDKATEIVGGDFATNQQVAEAVSTHNESEGAHADLREIVSNHTESKNNPHGVTKAQVGLGSVDNTGDANKPVSTAQAAAIADAKKAGTDAQSALETHKSDTTVHITAAERTAWNAKGSYSKPTGGIPKADLASSVQQSLLSADSAAADVAGVQKLIPAQASESNQLADKAFVNSSISTNTAYYISDNGSPFQSLAALQAYTGTLTNNDYAFVVGTDAAGNTTYTRYKYNSATQAWSEEYALNNSSFTAEQWAAIQSGITGAKVEQIAQNSEEIQSLKNQKGAANGIAELDASGKLKDAQKPSYTASEVGARPSTWTPTASDVGAIANPASGTAGQILTKTASGAVWADAPAGFTPQIIVTAPTGSTVACTNGSVTISASEVSGTWTFDLPEYGTWTATATKGSDSASGAVSVSEVRRYEITLAYTKIYGVQWDGTSTTKWTRTDDAAGFTDPAPYVSGASSYGSPFDSLYPWSGMTRVTDSEAGELVKIPKFWYRLQKVGNGLKLQIADRPVEGFSVSPAHMDRGDGKGERELVYVGRYHCGSSAYQSASGQAPKNNVTRSNFNTGIHNLGSTIWMWDWMMLVTIQVLYLVEFADWDSQRRIGYGCGNNGGVQPMGASDSMPYHTGTMQSGRSTYGVGTQYRYIEDLWGNVFDWIGGCYYNYNGMNIIKNPANYSDSSGGTSIGTPSSGYPSAFAVSENAGFEMLYPTSASGGNATYSCDNWYFSASYPCVYVGGFYSQDLYYGLFRVDCNGTSSAGSLVGSRLQKLP